jgi:hypothetical protein
MDAGLAVEDWEVGPAGENTEGFGPDRLGGHHPRLRILEAREA